MSAVLEAPFKKPVCGDMHQSGQTNVQAHLRDSLGGLINLQIVGTDPDLDSQPVVTSLEYRSQPLIRVTRE